MLLYLLTILIANIVIIGVNLLLNSMLYNLSVWYILLATVGSTVAVIVVDSIFAFAISRMPDKWFNKDLGIYTVSKQRKKIYEKLGIRKWKDKILDLGQLNHFRKDKIYEADNNDYLNKYLLEAKKGIWVHIFCMFAGFVIVFFFPLKYWFMFGVPVAIVNFMLNGMPIMSLKYNFPRIQLAIKRNCLKQKKEQQN